MRWGAEMRVPPSDCFAALTKRQQQIIQVSEHFHGAGASVDVSQNIFRMNGIKQLDGKLIGPTLLPRMMLWLGGCRLRILLGREALSLHTFPWPKVPYEQLSQVSEQFLMDLAGNCCPGIFIHHVLLSLFLCIPWKEQQQDSGVDHVELQESCDMHKLEELFLEADAARKASGLDSDSD